MIAAFLVAIFATVPALTPTQRAEHAAAEVICTEAGHALTWVVDKRASLVAHVIDHRTRGTRFGDRRNRTEKLLAILAAPNQWGHDCPLPFDALRGGLRALARRLVRGQMHFTPAPLWLTPDVLFVISEAESKKLGPRWGPRCLVRIEVGLAFYRDCEVRNGNLR